MLAFLLSQTILLLSVSSEDDLVSLPTCLHQHLFLSHGSAQGRSSMNVVSNLRDGGHNLSSDSSFYSCYFHSFSTQWPERSFQNDISGHVTLLLKIYHQLRIKFNSRLFTIWIMSSSIFSPHIFPQ